MKLSKKRFMKKQLMENKELMVYLKLYIMYNYKYVYFKRMKYMENEM